MVIAERKEVCKFEVDRKGNKLRESNKTRGHSV